MPNSSWPTQSKLNGIFVEFLSYIALFGIFFVLWVFYLYITVSEFKFLGFCFCVCRDVIYVCGLFNSLFLFFLSLFTCLFFKERKKKHGVGWLGSGRTWEELRKKKYDPNILYEKKLLKNSSHYIISLLICIWVSDLIRFICTPVTFNITRTIPKWTLI